MTRGTDREVPIDPGEGGSEPHPDPRRFRSHGLDQPPAGEPGIASTSDRLEQVHCPHQRQPCHRVRLKRSADRQHSGLTPRFKEGKSRAEASPGRASRRAQDLGGHSTACSGAEVNERDCADL